jgi:hypothetical protein
MVVLWQRRRGYNDCILGFGFADSDISEWAKNQLLLRLLRLRGD